MGGRLRTFGQRTRLHVRVARRFLLQAMVRETHYRVHFVTTIGVGLAELVLALVPILVLYSYTDEVNGWAQAEVLALVGLFQIVLGILATFVAPNMQRMTEYITKGELDAVLIRPVNSQFYLTFRWIRPAELGKVLTGLTILVAGLVRSGAEPGPAEIVQAGLLLFCGVALLTAVWSALVYLAFWMQAVEPIGIVFDSFLRAGQYPLSFFPAGVRAFLTFAFPVGFATTYPVRALTGDLGWNWVFTGLGLTVVAMVLLRSYWRFGLRFYSSASS